MSKPIIYGIKNCNTMQKAINALQANKTDFEFHDYKKQGVSAEKLSQWIDVDGLAAVINKKGMTWKKLSDDEKKSAESKEGAIAILQKYTSAIKRPILEIGNKSVIGFDENNVAYKAR